MEDIQRRLAEQSGILQEHGSYIGRLQGQFGVIIGLQIAQLAILGGILVKVFWG